MRYIKADQVLPQELLSQIQQYVDGVTLYIPRKAENRRSWGCESGYRRELLERNGKIREDYASGTPVGELAEQYHLSPKSIGRILRRK